MSTIKSQQEPVRPNGSHLELLATVTDIIVKEGNQLPEWFSNYSHEQRTRIAYDIDIIVHHFLKNANLLEIGSVPFLLTASLKQLGYSIEGMDVAPERFSGVIKRFDLKVYKSNIETELLPFHNEVYDGIIFNEVFEHLRINLISTMRELHRVIRHGGVLVLSTPNLRSFAVLRQLLLHNVVSDIYGAYAKLEKLGHMGHVREYTSQEVITFVERIGFKVEKIVYRGGYKANFFKKRMARLFPSLKRSFTIIGRKV